MKADQPLRFYNTLSRHEDKFNPVTSKLVTLYACGPTVYDFAHLGHFRAYIFVDILRRVLKFNGYQLLHVMNITDVGHLTDDADDGEDKMEKKASLENKSVWDIARFYTEDFFKAMKALNVEQPDIVCRATEHINEMIDLVRLIEERGYAYQITDGIYFDTAKLKDYGKLARLARDQLLAGARVEQNLKKKNAADFALWKFTPAGVKRQMEWDSPWGRGFPGWHIECTAMGLKYLGEKIDIHTGGIDHIPVHHTNEIAQAFGALGHDIVRFWLHNEFVMVNSEKMSKSKKNFYTLLDIRDHGISPLAVRLFFLQAHYRTPVNFTWRALGAAQQGLKNLYEKIQDVKSALADNPYVIERTVNRSLQRVRKNFLQAVNDDLNTAKALAVLWEVLKDEQLAREEQWALVLDFDQIFGLKLSDLAAPVQLKTPLAIKKLVQQREQARGQSNFILADQLRRQIEEAGFIIQDQADKTIVSLKKQ